MSGLKEHCAPQDDDTGILIWWPTPAPTSSSNLTDSSRMLASIVSGPTPKPTEFTPSDGAPASYISQEVQVVSMIIAFVILGLLVTFSCCMTKPSCCWHAWLNSWCSCNCFNGCTKGCCCCCASSKKKPIEDDEPLSTAAAVGSSQPDWLVRNFGWVRPIGAEGSELVVFQKQLGLLLWKSFIEKSRQQKTIGFYLGIPVLVLLTCWLIYGTFNNWMSSGVIELFLVPFSFVVVLQLPAVSIVSEKSLRLKESLRMMGMRESPYWCAYFISDGVIMGGLLSFLLSLEGLFMSLFWNLGASNDGDALASFGDFMGFFWFLWTYCLALTSLAFLISTLVDTPQTAGQASFFTLIAGVVIFLVFIFSPTLLDSALGTVAKQTAWCLFPPMALQIGLYSNSYIACQLHRSGNNDFLTLGDVSGMLVLDVVLFTFLAWYLGQVLPSEYGIQKPAWFLFLPSYWLGDDDSSLETGSKPQNPLNRSLIPNSERCATEEVNRDVIGEPTVEIRGLKKTFNTFSSNPFKAVDDLSFDMYENQIFSLLGHNGAGKTTTINMLTGLFPADSSSGDTTIYGRHITSEMAAARKHLGVCPQHDVLFESLTAREHILFFVLLKEGNGSTTWAEAGVEADALLEQFHLHERAHYVGGELSGGMKRKLSVSIALCGGSKLVVLDEPTAGMDPLARRDLWDLLKACRFGRTILLTTHYMEEADVLGDRIAIMSRGQLQCLGSSTFLKRTFGAGYKLVVTMKAGAIDKTTTATVVAKKNQNNSSSRNASSNSSNAVVQATGLAAHPVTQRLLEFVGKFVSGVSLNLKESNANSLVLVLPFDQASTFGDFFNEFDSTYSSLEAEGYGVTITDLEEVFLKVGEDHTLRENDSDNSASGDHSSLDIVANVNEERGEGDQGHVQAGGRLATTRTEGFQLSNFQGQVVGLLIKRLRTALNDVKTIPLVGFPIVAIVAAFTCNVTGQFGTAGTFSSNIATAAILLGAYIPLPGLIAEQVVEERVSKLRNVLTVMGCDVNAYWVGTFLGDFALFFVSVVALWITVPACIYSSEEARDTDLDQWMWAGAIFYFLPLFGLHICSFSYAASFAFPSPRIALVFMPLLCIILIFVPVVLILIFELGFGEQGMGIVTLDSKSQAGVVLWGIALLSPHGAFGLGLVTISTKDLTAQVDSYPPFYAICLIMAAESALYLFAALQVDKQALAVVEEQHYHNDENEHKNKPLDEDVLSERSRVMAMSPQEVSGEGAAYALRIAGLRKVYPAKSEGQAPLEAVKNLSVRVGKGELFGLLGANGAGKTTAISMVMRAAFPSAGVVHVNGHSVLSDFAKAGTCLGVVTQSNTLWGRLSCKDHLRLFARVRGVPSQTVETMVLDTIRDMELAPYADKLAMQLSGGMKRKLCVAIALIGDPEVVLLDEPSAGLDPVSRRNLWNVIMKTMAKRAVVLTTHSMEEAEALCTRIGIMVKGQLQVIGTPQHLKEKFGSGYEMIVTLDKGDDFDERVEGLVAFMAELYPEGSLLSSNGGLLTFRVPNSVMQVGKSFLALEHAKERFKISDYAIAQPTLEQVFVRTVVENSESERPTTKQDDTATGIAAEKRFKSTDGRGSGGGGSAPWVDRRASLGDEQTQRPSLVASGGRLSGGFAAEVQEMHQDLLSSGGLRTECCGLNSRSHRFLATATGLFAFLLFMTMSGLLGPSKNDYEDCHREAGKQPCAVPAFYLNSVVFVFSLAVSVVSCCGCCFCIPPNPEEENGN